MDAATTLSTIMGNVTTLLGGVTGMFTTLNTLWVVWLPITFIVFRFTFKTFKNLLMYRGRRRR